MTIDKQGSREVVEPGVVTRAEEQLGVSVLVRMSGGVRLRKQVVTETITQTIQVRREELQIEELGVADLTMQDTSTAETGTYSLREGEFELILHEERVILSTQIVPVERVLVRVQIVTDQIPIAETVRREQVEMIHDHNRASAPRDR